VGVEVRSQMVNLKCKYGMFEARASSFTEVDCGMRLLESNLKTGHACPLTG